MNRMVVIVRPLWLGACTGDEVVTAVPDATRVYTVDEFLAQPDLRKKVSAVCSNDPGRTGLDANCLNVRRADRVASFGNVANMPRIVP
ncbi:EexN family lipoprotein [Massilia sp. Leaf139]|uniref:EexN family lipoprotein n=1 Tax=Massilia sp. Leaf139 TaxID=1736272 RepID=UPI0006F7FE52|nr:EexN family lipoprotein [Massilia sp. Leaf139]KQQ96127.1 hypothetical protein ASF77_21725 [Massilia sp. Leaf139]